MRKQKCTRVCFCNSYLVKKPLHATESQIQSSHIFWIGTVKILEPLVVVFDRHILVCDFKVVGQRQDVAAEETQSRKPVFKTG